MPLSSAVLPGRDPEASALFGNDLTPLLEVLEGAVYVVCDARDDNPERRVVDPLVEIGELFPRLLEVNILGIDIVGVDICLLFELALAFSASRFVIPGGTSPPLLEVAEAFDRSVGEFYTHLEPARGSVSFQKGHVGLSSEILRIVFICGNIARLQQGTTVVASFVDPNVVVPYECIECVRLDVLGIVRDLHDCRPD